MPCKGEILFIDDDTYICNVLKKYLGQKGYSVDLCFSGNNAKKLIGKKDFDLILCDYRLPDLDGYHILKYVKEKSPSVPVIIMTAYAEISKAVKLIKSGAFDYLTKPMQPEEVLKVINNALKTGNGNAEDLSFEKDFITGKNEKILQIMEQIKAVAPTDITVMIEGETGSGKEYVARAIHLASKRNKNPFIAVDCGAIPRELANSVLFGHLKGSFTGAVNDKEGFFQEANGGTLFLDEVGNLPHENQVKILRALQDKTVTRIGENRAQKVDVRLISASNYNLMDLVGEGEFREDLYHRLNGFRIEVPPLRSRTEDIMLFADHFITQANRDLGKNVTKIEEAAMELMLNYHWHGNIRELQNVITRMVLLSMSEVITADLLPEEIRINSPGTAEANNSDSIIVKDITDLKSATLVTEKEVIRNALEKAGNNKSKAARLLNIDRKTLYNKMRLYDLEI